MDRRDDEKAAGDAWDLDALTAAKRAMLASRLGLTRTPLARLRSSLAIVTPLLGALFTSLIGLGD